MTDSPVAGRALPHASAAMHRTVPLHFRALQPYQQVYVRVAEGQSEARYRSRIVGVEAGQSLVIRTPSHMGMEVAIATGTTVGMEVPLPEGVWRYSTRVRETLDGPEPALRLHWPQPGTRIQRRNSVRAECRLSAHLRLRGAVAPEERTVEGTTVDLSAGGVRVRLEEPVPVHSEFGLRLFLPGNEPVECEARVVRGDAYVNAQGRLSHWVAAEFVNISGAASRRISRLVFNLDCQRRRIDLI